MSKQLGKQWSQRQDLEPFKTLSARSLGTKMWMQVPVFAGYAAFDDTLSWIVINIFLNHDTDKFVNLWSK